MVDYEALSARLRELRTSHRYTLEGAAAKTGLTASTLSRIETGRRVPSLDHLIALSSLYDVTLVDLLPPAFTDPRVRSKTRRLNGMILRTLSPPDSTWSVVEITLRKRSKQPGTLQTHEGREWLYVVSGLLTLSLGGTETLLREGDAAEFDTRLPHALRAESPTVTAIAIYSQEGRRIHFRAT